MAKMENDLLDCKVAALADAPVSTQLRRGPPRYVPGYRHCDGKGRCYRSGGYFYPGDVYSVDVNAGLRRDLLNRCMAARGFSPVELPRCRTGTAPALSTDLTDAMPPLSPNSCLFEGEGGQNRIIDAAG